MAISPQSVAASQTLQGRMSLCSWELGWRDLLLRSYEEPTEVESLVTAPTNDHLIVLVTRGGCEIEGLYAGKWQRARYAKGDIGMTAPGEEVSLRWWGARDQETLQLHIPASTLADVAKLDPSWTDEIRLPHQLTFPDPVVESVLQSLRRAVELKMPSLYADSAVHFLASHLLQFHARIRPMGSLGRDPGRMAIIDGLMRSSLSFDLSLDALAAEVGLSKFHFLRVFKDTFGETPFQRLTRLRMERARVLLDDRARSVTDVALDCGYGNPGHFAAAFRRAYGVSPQAFRSRKSR
ncbi:helix-turn-helix transcriptional regulator [Luteibacter sp. 3190]|uniref:helix-turn-helix transcriptional regulator n=1 Tax=Luteibacter sp. 3190 TaxID=2817736 RepID=UPI002863B009|nr:helix-turn-helix transcriptional regulator [Luteibacter sp. 3190]MDR6937477.1 AraC family transcriptional regulator [Luteibacter sp. 3190]